MYSRQVTSILRGAAVINEATADGLVCVGQLHYGNPYPRRPATSFSFHLAGCASVAALFDIPFQGHAFA